MPLNNLHVQFNKKDYYANIGLYKDNDRFCLILNDSQDKPFLTASVNLPNVRLFYNEMVLIADALDNGLLAALVGFEIVDFTHKVAFIGGRQYPIVKFCSGILD